VSTLVDFNPTPESTEGHDCSSSNDLLELCCRPTPAAGIPGLDSNTHTNGGGGTVPPLHYPLIIDQSRQQRLDGRFNLNEVFWIDVD
jgi:hypothetical protein